MSHSLARDGTYLSGPVRVMTNGRGRAWVLKDSLKYRGAVKITPLVVETAFFQRTLDCSHDAELASEAVGARNWQSRNRA